MATNASGQSPKKQKTKEKKPKKIFYDLINLKMNFNEQIAMCQLKMPSKLPASYDPNFGDNPLVILDVKQASEDTHCLKLLRDCLHKNILHANLVMKRDPYLLVFTEEYTGTLLSYFKSGEPFIPKYARSGERYAVPSAKLQSAVTQILDGFKTLWLYGKYHGNFKLDNTYYHKAKDGDVTVKLASFKSKGTTESDQHYQAKDLQSLGIALKEMSQMVNDLKVDGYVLDCSKIDHLVNRLKEVSAGDLNCAMDEIRTYPFFWTQVERKEFFVSQIPIALLNNSIKAKIEAEQKLCTLPWNGHDYKGFLPLMVKYRKDNNVAAYDFNSRVCYVQFISGIYTHEVQLKNAYAAADDAAKSVNVLLLYRLLPRPPRPVDQD